MFVKGLATSDPFGFVEPRALLNGGNLLPASVIEFGGVMDEWLGNEQPLYEIAFRGSVYRFIRRASGGSGPTELIRSQAPGLERDGVLLPAPSAFPNSPLSVLKELSYLTGASETAVATEAYDILAYRFKNQYRYPKTMEPEGFRLEQLYLLQVEESGNWTTLYDKPLRVDSTLWERFLNFLDNALPHEIAQYAWSRQAWRDFRSSGIPFVKAAARLRLGPGVAPVPIEGKSLLSMAASPRAPWLMRREPWTGHASP